MFVIYINDLNENLGGMVNKFANDTEIGGIGGTFVTKS